MSTSVILGRPVIPISGTSPTTPPLCASSFPANRRAAVRSMPIERHERTAIHYNERGRTWLHRIGQGSLHRAEGRPDRAVRSHRVRAPRLDGRGTIRSPVQASGVERGLPTSSNGEGRGRGSSANASIGIPPVLELELLRQTVGSRAPAASPGAGHVPTPSDDTPPARASGGGRTPIDGGRAAHPEPQNLGAGGSRL